MSLIHHTTLTPTKLELLAGWLPGRPWFLGGPDGCVLDRAGGYRLDDPEGEVGIEFMVVTDASGPLPVAYQVPFTYRSAPLEGAEHALIGTTEHGVLGRRWVYDGAHDPVLVGQLYALLCGTAEPQAQRVSHTPDPTVVVERAGGPLPATAPVRAPLTAADGPHGAEVPVPAGAEGLILRIHRLLRPHPADADTAGPESPGSDTAGSHTAETPAGAKGSGAALAHVTAGWNLPDGTGVRGAFAAVLRA